jgi:hypothetical protein
MAEPPPIDPDVVRELERLADAIAARDDHAARLEWLVDTLIPTLSPQDVAEQRIPAP